MSFQVGIIGVPNVGKSTLFKALTKRQVDIADYPFTTIHPNIGTVAVPDKRLEEIAKIIKPEKIIPTIIEFVDIAGLVKNAHKGEGLGNQFLAQIRSCDALVQVIKCFDKEKKPEEEIEIIKNELKMKDLDSKEKENLLSEKPIIYLFNSDNNECPSLTKGLSLNLKLEDPGVDQLILTCYNVLNLITFFTIKGGIETRAWTIKRGIKCSEAGQKVHSDFSEKFIRAEVINWQELITAGNWRQARELGLLKIRGKEYQVEDGDVIEFKI